jgi:hypothetical protein
LDVETVEAGTVDAGVGVNGTMNAMELAIPIQVEELPEGGFLGTSDSSRPRSAGSDSC